MVTRMAVEKVPGIKGIMKGLALEAQTSEFFYTA